LFLELGNVVNPILDHSQVITNFMGFKSSPNGPNPFRLEKHRDSDTMEFCDRKFNGFGFALALRKAV
jgi:hypothetical protein